MLAALRNLASQNAVWPPIDYELRAPRSNGYLKGLVLNAGAGWRDISHLVDGTLLNQDIAWPGESRKNIDIFSPLHSIPRPDRTFDSIVCIAVLEHVGNPAEVVTEMFRVLRPGGYIIASVPFLQPEHKIPTDYQRYTRDGLGKLFTDHGFEITDTRAVFTVYHTLHWLAYEWLTLKSTVVYKVLRYLIVPPLAMLAKRSSLQSDKLASAFQVVARRPPLEHERGLDGADRSGVDCPTQ